MQSRSMCASLQISKMWCKIAYRCLNHDILQIKFRKPLSIAAVNVSHSKLEFVNMSYFFVKLYEPSTSPKKPKLMGKEDNAFIFQHSLSMWLFSLHMHQKWDVIF